MDRTLKCYHSFTDINNNMVFYYLGKKAAKQFNVEDIFEKARRTAMELSRSKERGRIVVHLWDFWTISL